MDFNILGKDISIRPYFGLGYAFNVANYGDSLYRQNTLSSVNNFGYNLQGTTNANNVLPNTFHQLGGIIGFAVNEKILFEFSGHGSIIDSSGGGIFDVPIVSGNRTITDHYESISTASMNTFRATVGYILDEEIFGKYGDKNKIILMAGIAVGIYNTSVIDKTLGYSVSTGSTGVNTTDIERGTNTTKSTNIIISPEIGLAYQRYIADHLSLRVDARMNMLGANGTAAINGTIMASVLFHV